MSKIKYKIVKKISRYELIRAGASQELDKSYGAAFGYNVYEELLKEKTYDFLIWIQVNDFRRFLEENGFIEKVPELQFVSGVIFDIRTTTRYSRSKIIDTIMITSNRGYEWSIISLKNGMALKGNCFVDKRAYPNGIPESLLEVITSQAYHNSSFIDYATRRRFKNDNTSD